MRICSAVVSRSCKYSALGIVRVPFRERRLRRSSIASYHAVKARSACAALLGLDFAWDAARWTSAGMRHVAACDGWRIFDCGFYDEGWTMQPVSACRFGMIATPCRQPNSKTVGRRKGMMVTSVIASANGYVFYAESRARVPIDVDAARNLPKGAAPRVGRRVHSRLQRASNTHVPSRTPPPTPNFAPERGYNARSRR
jgi:hypothetical protein